MDIAIGWKLQVGCVSQWLWEAHLDGKLNWDGKQICISSAIGMEIPSEMDS